ncbi:MAG: translocation/assembly module TamB domain-containing protein [Dolichospermum sp.]
MSNSSSQNSHSRNSGFERLWLTILSQGGLVLGAVLVLGIIVGVWRLRNFVDHDLVPLVTKNLTNTLNRPVKLGAVKSFSLTGVSFKASEIPTTDTDSDKVNTKAVEVGFDPWQLVINRNLLLDVTLINPDIYIEQDIQGRWLTTTITLPPGKALIQTDLDKLRFRDANLVLVPKVSVLEKNSLPVKVEFSGINGTAKLLNQNRLIKLEVAGKGVSGGNISIVGDLIPQKVLAGNFRIQAENILAADITRIVDLPITLKTGRVNGDLQIKVVPREKTLLYGQANLAGVTVQISGIPQLLNNSQGYLSFDGLAIKLDQIITNYGQIPVTVSGIIDQESGFNLKGRVNAVSLANAQTTLKVKLPVPVTGVAQADLRILGKISQPVLSGSVSSLKNVQIDKVDFQKVSGKFELISSKSLLKITDIQGKTRYQGQVKGEGTIKLSAVPQLDFNLTGENISGDAIAQVYNIKTGFPIGLLSATAQLKGAENKTQTIVKLQATEAKYPTTLTTIINSDINSHQKVSFRDVVANVGSGTVRGNGTYINGNWQFSAQANKIQLASLVDQKQQENISLTGAEFNGGLRLSGNSSPFKIETIIPENANVNIAGGTVNIAQLDLQEQNFTALLLGRNLRLGKIFRQKQTNPILNYPLTGNLVIGGNRENFQLKTLTALGEGFLSVGGGKIKAGNIQVAEGRYQAKIEADNVPLISLASVPPPWQGDITGEFQVAGSVESFQPSTIQGEGKGRLKLPNGTVTAADIQVNDGNYQASLATSGLELRSFGSKLQGQLTGKLQLAGNLANARLADIAAVGQLQFNRGLPGINPPIWLYIGWNGKKLVIDSYNNANLRIKGYLLANAEKVGIPEITDMNLNLNINNYNLQKLPIKVPNKVDIGGNLDFSGQLRGKPTAPNITGKLGLRNLRLQKLVFEPSLTGSVKAVSGEGLNLDIVGEKERIAVKLDRNNRPKSFLIKWRQTLLSGIETDGNLAVGMTNLPLEALNVILPDDTLLSPGGVGGLLNGNLQINSQTLATEGNIAIEKPEIGRIKGDRFQTQLRYDNQTFILGNSELKKGESRYNFDANIRPWTQKPQLRANIKINKGNIQDILNVAQIFEIQDLQRGLKAPKYGKAGNLTAKSQKLPNQSLFSQMQRLSEIDALVTAQERRRVNATPIPELRDLKGILNGFISINTVTADQPRIRFNLRGQNFTWGKRTEPSRFYDVEKVVVKGSLEEGILRLQPLQIENQQKLIAFTGNIGNNRQSGQLTVQNFPLGRVNDLVKLPVGIGGKLNLTTTIAGSINNPQAIGELNIIEGTINQKQIATTNATFNYTNGRLNFSSNLSGVEKEPGTKISGSIPYQTPVATRKPESNQINLDVKVQNEGLTLLNLFTNEIAFENGQGEIDLKVSGTLKKPLVEGKASLSNATFSAQALPGKLTNINGSAEFDLNRVFVDNLEGRFSNGKVKVVGELPIFTSQNMKTENALTVNLEQLALKLKGLYQGGASGKLEITGSLLQPVIGGKIELSDGQVLLAESKNVNSAKGKISIPQKYPETENKITKLNKLELNLGKNVQITSPPLFKFQAAGDLIVSGSLAEPVPEGTIKLTKGAVNLFTTQLGLAQGYEHTATFISSQPRDPYLDIRLFAKILDVVQNNDISKQSSVGSLGLSGLETVRVEASINGLSSQINENLQLKSSPARSETQIVALLGGGFIDTKERGDIKLGLINIAGSAVFSNFQGAFNQIGDAFGLSELRIFPTILSQRPEAGRNNSSLELALEAGIDISPKFSFSTIKILTARDPVQWGINYRINNELRLRSSTNLTDDTRGVIEFERKF